MRRPLFEARQRAAPFQEVTRVSTFFRLAWPARLLYKAEPMGAGGRGGRRYMSIAAAISICSLIGTVPLKQRAYDVKTSADLPGAAFEAVAGPLDVPTWVRRLPAASPLRAAMPAAPGKFELLGHDPLLNRGMNAALAVHGRYAYIGSRTDGTHPNSEVLVVDVGDPRNPSVVGRIGRPYEANVGESSRELRVLPDQDLLLVLNHGCSELIHACVNGTQAGRNVVTSTIRFYDIRGAHGAAPVLVGTYTPTRTEAQTPHEFFIWHDPVRAGRTLLYETAPSTEASGKQNLYVVDISRAREGVFKEIATWNTKIGDPDADTRLHSLTVSNDGKRAYLAYLGGGFLVADTSDFADARPNPAVRLITPVANRVHWGDPGAHSAIGLPGRPAWAMTTDEVYGKLGGLLPAHGCPWGWVRFINLANPVRPRIASEYKLPVNDPKTCADVPQDRENFSSFSSHNPTLTRNVAFLTWHAAGLQAIDIADPAHPKPAASFLPEPLPYVAQEDPALSSGRDKVVMWSFPIIQNGLIYAVDIRNGLYILRYSGPHAAEVSSVGFLDGNSNSGDIPRLSAPPSAAR
jgi:hypothetical protein